MHLGAHKAIFFAIKQGANEHLDLFFPLPSPLSPAALPATPPLAWSEAQDGFCALGGGEKPLLFIDWRTRMSEWPTHLH